jgi:hypothetical protein
MEKISAGVLKMFINSKLKFVKILTTIHTEAGIDKIIQIKPETGI